MFFRTTRTDEARAVPLMLSTLAAPSLFPVIFAGTKIATRTNWTPIEQLGVGDFVLTAEHGEQVITAMEVSTLDASSTKKMSNQWPVHIPEGVLGNSSPMIVAPDMQLVVEDDAAGLLFGQTCVSLKAEDLIGHRGISRAHLSTVMTRYTVEFDKGVSLVAEGGVFLDMPSPHKKELRFKALDARQARLLVRQMGEENDTRRSRKMASGWI